MPFDFISNFSHKWENRRQYEKLDWQLLNFIPNFAHIYLPYMVRKRQTNKELIRFTVFGFDKSLIWIFITMVKKTLADIRVGAKVIGLSITT